MNGFNISYIGYPGLGGPGQQPQPIGIQSSQYVPAAGVGRPGYYTSPSGSTTTSSSYSATTAKPVLSANGLYVNSLTGQPWHGAYKNPSSNQTSYYSNGKPVADIGLVGAQNPDISVTQTQKNPAISSQVAGEVAQNAAGTAEANKNFNDYLTEAQNLGAAGATQLAADQAAIDPTSTINTLNKNTADTNAKINQTNEDYAANQNKVQGAVQAATNNYTGDLNSRLTALEAATNQTNQNLVANNNQYATAQAGVQGDIAANNQAYKTQADQNLASLGTNLTAEQQAYEQAAQNVANQAYQQAQKQISLYQLGSGTPTSGSGNLSNRYIAAYNNINIPLQAQLDQMRTAQINQLYGLGAGVQNQEYNNLQNEYAGQGALNSDLANRGQTLQQYLQSTYGNLYNAGIGSDQSTLGANLAAANSQGSLNSDLANRYTAAAQYTGNNTAQNAQYIQQLKDQTAGMTRAQAAQYLQQLAVPIETAQQILGGQTSNLAALTNLDQAANTYTFSTPFNSSAIPASPAFGVRAPRANRYTAGTGSSGSGGLNLGNIGDVATSQIGQLNSPQYNGLPSGPVANSYSPTTTQTYGATYGQPQYGNGTTGPLTSNGDGTYTDEGGQAWVIMNGQYVPYTYALQQVGQGVGAV